MPSPLVLRYYQSAGVNDLRRAYADGFRALLYCLPTGGGKTVIIAVIVVEAVKRGNRVLIVVHRRELLRQASAKLTAAGVDHGFIAAGGPSDPAAAVHIGSIQTLVRRLDRIGQYDIIIIDEAHHAVAGTWRKLID